MKEFFICLFLAFPLSSFAQNANFTLSTSAGCSPLLVSFDASSSTGSNLTYQWDFGNGNTAIGQNQQNPGAIYTNPGSYVVSLEVVDDRGNRSAIFSATITVYPNPMADFSVDIQTGCPDLAVQFSDLSSSANGNISEWLWDFGDGNSSTLPNPTHTYASGTFPVSLLVKDANACADIQVYNNLITVEPEIEIAFVDTGPRLTCNNSLRVSFDPSLTTTGSGPFSYLWDFGDGTTSTAEEPTKTYTTYGLFSVSLQVTDLSTGCSHTFTETDYIRLIDNTLDIGLNPGPGCDPSITFTNLSNSLQADFISTWYFGDGDSLTGPAMAPGILSPTHTYNQPGSYTISLKLDMGNGICVETFTLPNPVEVRGAPNLDFTVDKQVSCLTPFSVNFNTVAPDAVSWLWDFGDGNTSTLQNPTHIYTNLGRYTVSLTIADNTGCSNTLSIDDFIRVEAAQANFTHNLNTYTVFPDLWDGRDASVIRGGCLPLDIDFTDASHSPTPIVSWDWDFGDGNTLLGANANPQHTYVNEGEFTVSLTITTLDGCVSTATCDSCIRAGNRPTALLDTSAYPLLQCCSASTLFQNETDSGTHDYVWYSVTTGDWDGFLVNDTSNGDWDFGSTVPVFRDSGQFVSTMFYAYNKGCVDSFYLDKWTMLRPPYASAGIDTFQCKSNWPPGGVVVFDTSNTVYLLDTAYVDSVEWSFPDGSTSHEFYPTYTFPDTGAYWVGVTVWNFDNGCSCKTSGEQFLRIIEQPDTSFSFSPDEGCAPLDVEFMGPTQDVSTWNWDLGGGLTSTETNPLFILDSLGRYDVSLVVANDRGCADTVFLPDAIRVDGIIPQISLSQEMGCIPLNLSLRDESVSSAPIVSRTWYLGDGSVVQGNDSQLIHVYDSMLFLPPFQLEGIPIILEVEDSTGCMASDTAYLKLIQPLVEYAMDTISICSGDTLALLGAEGDSLSISSLNYFWEFTRASLDTSTQQNPRPFFPGGVSQSIRLTVEDSLGCRNTRVDSVFVNPRLPQANFTAFPTGAVCPPLLVTFTDQSVAGNAPITQWLWDFGDGTQSSLQNPIKIFSDFNTYDISLRVTDSLGCTNVFMIPDLVQLTGVQGGFTMNTDVICAYDSILFTANSPNAGSYTWDFGDGSIGFGRVVRHPYNEAGLNIPTLILEDSTGTCSVSISDTLLVNPLPPLDMPLDTSFCEGGIADFDVFTAGAEYLWNTGATSSSISASQTGNFSVRVSYPATGCEVRGEVGLEVWENPLVSIEGGEGLCEGDTLFLYAESPDSLESYVWNKPSAIPSKDAEIYVDFNTTQMLYLSVEDVRGCPAEDSLLIQVIPYPDIDLSFDPVCEGDTLYLDATAANIQDPSATYFWWQDQSPLGNQGPLLELIEAGKYELLFDLMGCPAEFVVDIHFNPLPQSDIYREHPNCVYKGKPVSLDAGEAFAYNWLHSGEQSRTVEVVRADTYYVEVFNEFLCKTTDSTVVIDACPPLLYVPTAFSPNGDGINEEFSWGGDYLATFDMKIYSRWGILMYETQNPYAFWNGTYKQGKVQEGVYTWVVRYSGTHPDYQQIFQRAGTVTLFR